MRQVPSTDAALPAAMKKWRKWQRKGGKWQVRLLSVDGELKELNCPGAYHLHKKYARVLVEAGKRGGHTLVAEKMPKGTERIER